MIKEGDTFDMKSLGPHTVGLIKQNRRGKVIFQGKYPLEKFGKFAELNESSESYGSSDKASFEPASSEKSSANDNVITVSYDENREEEETPTPEANVAEEHDLIPAHVQSDYVERTVATETEAEGDKNYSFADLDLTGYYNDDIVASLASSSNLVINENLDSIFSNVDEVVPPTTETRKPDEVLETTLPTTNQMANTATPMETVIGFPPPVSASPTIEPFMSDLTSTQTGQPPL